MPMIAAGLFCIKCEVCINCAILAHFCTYLLQSFCRMLLHRHQNMYSHCDAPPHPWNIDIVPIKWTSAGSHRSVRSCSRRKLYPVIQNIDVESTRPFKNTHLIECRVNVCSRKMDPIQSYKSSFHHHSCMLWRHFQEYPLSFTFISFTVRGGHRGPLSTRM